MWIKGCRCVLGENMWYKYRKFTSIDEARCWGKRFYSYWLPNYQLGGKLRGNYDTENPERFLQSGMEIPLEVQQILLQNPAVQELINNIQAQKANNKPNIPDSAEIPRNTPESKMQIYE